MKVDWAAIVGNAVSIAVVIVLLVAIFARGVVTPAAMIVVAGVSVAVASWIFIMLSSASFRRAARGEADGPTGDEALRAITRMNDEQRGGATVLRVVLFAQVVVVALVFGPDSAEFLAALSAFAISILLAMRWLKDVNSTQ